MKPKILLVEDESDIRSLIRLHLDRLGYEVIEASGGEVAIKALQSPGIHLALVDWMLPGISGIELIRVIRQNSALRALPILMLTAKSEPVDVVAGLDAGADDYVTKPFDPSILTARVKALLRRGGEPQSAQTDEVQIQNLVIRPEKHEVSCSGQTISLTPSEFKLLHALAMQRGKVFTREKLITLVQGNDISVVDRTIDTHIFGLRKKLGPCADILETIRGIGYRVKDFT